MKHFRSKFYLDVLLNVGLEKVVFTESKEVPTARETKSDKVFLGLFVNTRGKWPENIFPHLHNLANNHQGQDGSFRLYNKSTYQEFHRVVISVIHNFQLKLSELNSYYREGSCIIKDAKELISKVIWYGHLLQKLCAGAALRMYLESINESLSDLLYQPAPRRRFSFKEVSRSGLDTAVEVADAEELEADDGDFEVAQDSEESAVEHLRASQICLRWLKLLIAQFDAANILMRHINLPSFPDISIKILRNPPGRRSLMPWKVLLSNPKYFPKQPTRDQVPDTGRDRDNANIISSLERAISSNPYELGFHLEEIQDLSMLWSPNVEKRRARRGGSYS
jgi:hypothetical protein